MDKKEKLTFRKLELEDAFLILDIIDALGIDEFKDCFKNDEITSKIKDISKNKDEKIDIEKIKYEFGIDAVMKCVSKIIKNIKGCKKEVYILVSALSGIELDKVSKLGLWKIASNLFALTKDEDLKDFLELASSLKK